MFGAVRVSSSYVGFLTHLKPFGSRPLGAVPPTGAARGAIMLIPHLSGAYNDMSTHTNVPSGVGGRFELPLLPGGKYGNRLLVTSFDRQGILNSVVVSALRRKQKWYIAKIRIYVGRKLNNFYMSSHIFNIFTQSRHIGYR